MSETIPRRYLRKIMMLCSAAVLACTTLQVAAQRYPDRPIKIVHPFPGGPVDQFARIIAHKLHAGLGQPVIVDGKAGAGGTIGVSAAVNAPPDGYTLLVTTGSTQLTQPVIRKKMPYDVEKDLIPIASSGLTPLVIMVHPSLPVTTLRELIDYAKANPDVVTYGSSGNGTALHLAGEVFSTVTGVRLTHVPYKTAAAATVDTLGGQVKLMFSSVPLAAPNILSGKLRGIAVMGKDRVPALPRLQTTAELGMSGLNFYNYIGVYAPAGTPPEVVDRITRVLRPAFAESEILTYFEVGGFPPTAMFGAAFAQEERAQRAALAEVLKKARVPLID